MQNRLHFSIAMLGISFLLNGQLEYANAYDDSETAHRILADADASTSQHDQMEYTQEGQSSPDSNDATTQPPVESPDSHHDASTTQPQCDSPAGSHHETPTNQSQDNSSSDDRYNHPTNQQQDNSSSDSRYNHPTNQQQNNSSSDDRYNRPTNQQQNNSSSDDRYNRYASPNQPDANARPDVPLKRIIDQFKGSSTQPPVNQPTRSGTSKPGDVLIETGDLVDDPGLLDAMIGKETQPEVVEVAASPVDKTVVDNIKSLEKTASQCTKDSFSAVAAEAEKLGSSLSDGSQLPEAAKCFEIAYQTRSRFVPPLDSSLLSSATGIASASFGGDNFENAIKWYQQCLQLIEKGNPSDSAEQNLSLAKCLGGLAASYLIQSDAKSALPYAQRLYDLVKLKYGPQSTQACWGAATLGDCYRLTGDAKFKSLENELFDICLAKAGGVKRTGSMIKPLIKLIANRNREETIVMESRSPALPASIDPEGINEKDNLPTAKIIDADQMRFKELSPTQHSSKSRDKQQLIANVLQPGRQLNPAFNQDVPLRFWFPSVAAPRAVVVCVHGMCLHSGSYAALAGSLQARGYVVVALDVRGLGTWVNSFGQDFLNLDASLADIHNTVERMHGLFPSTPIFLLGESMGGGIALHSTARNPEHIAGVISSVPGASRFNQAKETFMVLLNLPFGLNRPLNIGDSLLAKATADPNVRQAWKADPLARKTLSPKELISFQLFMSGNGKSAAKIKSKPVLVIQGMDDHLVKPPSTIKLYSLISSSNKTLLKVNSGEHLTFELNQCAPIVLEHVIKWVQSNSR